MLGYALSLLFASALAESYQAPQVGLQGPGLNAPEIQSEEWDSHRNYRIQATPGQDRSISSEEELEGADSLEALPYRSQDRSPSSEGVGSMGDHPLFWRYQAE